MSQQPSCSIAQQQQQEMFITSNAVSMEGGTSTQQIVEIVQPFDQNHQMQIQPSYQQMQPMEHKPNTIYDDGHFMQVE